MLVFLWDKRGMEECALLVMLLLQWRFYQQCLRHKAKGIWNKVVGSLNMEKHYGSTWVTEVLNLTRFCSKGKIQRQYVSYMRMWHVLNIWQNMLKIKMSLKINTVILNPVLVLYVCTSGNYIFCVLYPDSQKVCPHWCIKNEAWTKRLK